MLAYKSITMKWYALGRATKNGLKKSVFEIMNAGLNVSWLYHKMPVVSNAIENRRIIFRESKGQSEA